MWCNAIRLQMQCYVMWKYVLNVLCINWSTSETVTLIDVGRGDFDVKANMGTQIRGAMWDYTILFAAWKFTISYIYVCLCVVFRAKIEVELRVFGNILNCGHIVGARVWRIERFFIGQNEVFGLVVWRKLRLMWRQRNWRIETDLMGAVVVIGWAEIQCNLAGFELSTHVSLLCVYIEMRCPCNCSS